VTKTRVITSSLFALASTVLSAQERTRTLVVHGAVSDYVTRYGIPEVLVMAVGAQSNADVARTANDGTFSLRVVRPDTTRTIALRVRMIGYRSLLRTVTLDADTGAVNFVLERDTVDLLPLVGGVSPRYPPVLEIDHVIVGIDSLERGMDLLRDFTGLTAVYGGAHPGRGTHNALLSLGDGKYLELLAPNPKEPVSSPSNTELSRYKDLTPIGFAMRAPNAESLSVVFARRGLTHGSVRPGSRVRPDGSTLRWKTFTPWGADNRSILPFFIEWSPGPHPSTDSPRGCRLSTVMVGAPEPNAVGELLQRASIGVGVATTNRDGIWLWLNCPRGLFRLPLIGQPVPAAFRIPATVKSPDPWLLSAGNVAHQ